MTDLFDDFMKAVEKAHNKKHISFSKEYTDWMRDNGYATHDPNTEYDPLSELSVKIDNLVQGNSTIETIGDFTLTLKTEPTTSWPPVTTDDEGWAVSYNGEEIQHILEVSECSNTTYVAVDTIFDSWDNAKADFRIRKPLVEVKPTETTVVVNGWTPVD